MATSNDRDPKRGSPLPADFDDPSIPVLTERLTLPPLDIDFTLPPALTQPPPPPPPAPAPLAPVARAAMTGPAASPAPPPAIHGLDTLPPQPLPPAPVPAIAALRVETAGEAIAAPRTDQDWARRELDLRESILRELSMRLPQNVEQIVREKMQSGIQSALDRLAAETRLAIAASLRDLVDKAVKAELAALKARDK